MKVPKMKIEVSTEELMAILADVRAPISDMAEAISTAMEGLRVSAERIAEADRRLAEAIVDGTPDEPANPADMTIAGFTLKGVAEEQFTRLRQEDVDELSDVTEVPFHSLYTPPRPVMHTEAVNEPVLLTRIEDSHQFPLEDHEREMLKQVFGNRAGQMIWLAPQPLQVPYDPPASAEPVLVAISADSGETWQMLAPLDPAPQPTLRLVPDHPPHGDPR